MLRTFVVAVWLFAFSSFSLANDAAAAVGAGGLQLRREASISMEKETLTITSPKGEYGTVNVKYEFLNLSDQDIETEVAFPLPPEGAEDQSDHTTVTDFRVLVEGQEIPFETDYKAILKGRDVTQVLRDLKLDLPDFGGFDWTEGSAAQIHQLPAADRARLVRAGLIEKNQDFPLWQLLTTYHWRQKFPAHSVVHVEHEYRPISGRSNLAIGQVERAMRHQKVKDINGNYGLLSLFCVNNETVRRLRADVVAKYGTDPKHDWESVGVGWIDYILTTANSWHGPIKDFELIIKTDPGWHLASCFDPSIAATTDTTMRLHFNNYTPTKELSIGFLYSMF